MKNWETIVNICHANTPGSYLFYRWWFVTLNGKKINRIIEYGELSCDDDQEAIRLNKQYAQGKRSICSSSIRPYIHLSTVTIYNSVKCKNNSWIFNIEQCSSQVNYHNFFIFSSHSWRSIQIISIKCTNTNDSCTVHIWNKFYARKRKSERKKKRTEKFIDWRPESEIMYYH